MAILPLRQLPLLLCLLVACIQPSEPLQGAKASPLATHASSLDAGWVEVNREPLKTRTLHTATLLPDGSILVAGGVELLMAQAPPRVNSISSAARYDPTTGTWSELKPLNQYRFAHTATLLPNGKLLVVGGVANEAAIRHCELYDPVTQQWEVADSLNEARAYHTATLLPNGKVLVVGGVSLDGEFPSTAELYDPSQNRWTRTKDPLNEGRAFHTATLLRGGKVLITGGMAKTGNPDDTLVVPWDGGGQITWAGTSIVKTAKLYDSTSDHWRDAAAPLLEDRAAHTATLLPDGKVLVVGGWGRGDGNKIGVVLPFMTASGVTSPLSAELYDPAANSWSRMSQFLEAGRAFHTATLLPGSRLLVTGGSAGTGPLDSAEVYLPEAGDSGTWLSMKMPESRVGHCATLLPGGRVFITGGASATSTNWQVLSSSVLYDPSNRGWSSVSGMDAHRSGVTATLLPGGGVLVVDGLPESDGGVASEEYAHDPVMRTWSRQSVAARNQARRGHTATLLPNDKVLVMGGEFADGGLLNSTMLYDPATQTWSDGTTPRNGRSFHTATLLPNGKVLMVGGYTRDSGFKDTAELYTPDDHGGRWAPAMKMPVPDNSHPLTKLTHHTATLLPDGRVLVTGGAAQESPQHHTYLYAPLQDEWLYAGPLSRGRRSHTATLLPSGEVLVTGGYGTGGESLDTTELYTPAPDGGVGHWQTAATMTSPRAEHTATLLPTGQLLVTGGYKKEGAERQSLSSAEVYDPVSQKWSQVEPMREAHAGHAVVVLLDGTPLIVGGEGEDGGLSLAEVYEERYHRELPGLSIRPLGADASLEPGAEVLIEGLGFRNQPESSSGNGSSPGNSPLLSLRSLDNQLWAPFLPWASSEWSDTAVRTELPVLPGGRYVLSVTTGGMTASQVIRINNAQFPSVQCNEPPSGPTLQTRMAFSCASTAKDLTSLECSLDDASFTPCAAALPFTDLAHGDHSFRARATDTAGNQSLVEYSWTVDREAPAVLLRSNVSGETRATNATFSFVSDASDVKRYECSLDGAPFSECRSPVRHEGMSPGPHRFAVRAIDEARDREPAGTDRQDASPATHEWTVLDMRGYYDAGCSAGGSLTWLGGPWALLWVGLLRRRRSR
ncbi:Kelch repeat-containing protein [Pyxidicoccus fallax]|nr:kelch repeat-containing protein [Pyxidicoccus fallax]